uniref:Somatostatin/Cortistatin C-terminal domain-containing protein n=1 Tax=Oncorhynchus mykiss TaxID=8022 RepID=A0A8C7S6Q9_ONCMY
MALTGIWCAFVLVCVSLCQTGKNIVFLSQVSADDKYNFVWLLYKLSQSHHDNTLKINSLPRGPESVGKQESRRETMPQDSRVRKEGCKVFFWKSWTAC